MTAYVVHEVPELDRPVLIVMLQGWIDASAAAQGAMAVVEEQCAVRTIATFDRDMFIDYRARRPVMELREGLSAQLNWPDIELKCGRDSLGNDVLTLSGHEPDAAWMSFAEAVTELAIRFGVRMVVGLGAYPFGSPHTRQAQLSCTTPDPELLSTVSYLRSTLEVPAGMAAVLEHAMFNHGIPAIGLWAQVPHYVAAMGFPAASVALVNGLNATAGLDVPVNGLRGEALLQRTRLDDLVARNEEHRHMVRRLEREYDATFGATDGHADCLDADDDDLLNADSLPSADELAEELEQFLRDQEPG